MNTCSLFPSVVILDTAPDIKGKAASPLRPCGLCDRAAVRGCFRSPLEGGPRMTQEVPVQVQ